MAAVESGTVQGAADALTLTQSAATKRIQRLESRAGAGLLHRDPRGVEPTDLGQRLYPLAKQALAALAEAGAARPGRRRGPGPAHQRQSDVGGVPASRLDGRLPGSGARRASPAGDRELSRRRGRPPRRPLGGGFTIISELAVEAEVRAGTLVALPLRGLDLRRKLQAVRRSRGPHRPPARAFWHWLAQLSAPAPGS